MHLKFFVVDRVDIIKNSEVETDSLCHIDVNSWFKSNNISPDEMNTIRQYIFEEWLSKKIYSARSRIIFGHVLAVSYTGPNDKFVRLIEQKILEILQVHSCEGFLFP